MDQRAAASNWQKLLITTDMFVLSAYIQTWAKPHEVLTIYIEGDGLAWLSRTTPSDDPTPLTALGLQLALQHQAGPAAYLGRPCQNLPEAARKNCRQRWWTDGRFAPEVISASSAAIDVLKARYGASRLILVGYSGGAAVAALVAAQRRDVARLITVAGNLDTSAWTRLQRVDPLHGSRNPADAAMRLTDLPQYHLAGSKDDVVPPEIVAAYLARFPAGRGGTLKVVPGFDHACCWAQAWPTLLREAMPAAPLGP